MMVKKVFELVLIESLFSSLFQLSILSHFLVLSPQKRNVGLREDRDKDENDKFKIFFFASEISSFLETIQVEIWILILAERFNLLICSFKDQRALS